MAAIIDQLKSSLEGQIVRKLTVSPKKLMLNLSFLSQDFQGQKSVELISQVGLAGSAVSSLLFSLLPRVQLSESSYAGSRLHSRTCDWRPACPAGSIRRRNARDVACELARSFLPFLVLSSLPLPLHLARTCRLTLPLNCLLNRAPQVIVPSWPFLKKHPVAWRSPIPVFADTKKTD